MIFVCSASSCSGDQALCIFVSAACDRCRVDVISITDRCRVFEQSCGVVLKVASNHVESIRLLDVAESLEHCAEVIVDGAKSERVLPCGDD